MCDQINYIGVWVSDKRLCRTICFKFGVQAITSGLSWISHGIAVLKRTRCSHHKDKTT